MIARWKRTVLARLSEQGLVQVLMKQRNGQPWTPEDKALLKRELRALARWVPILLLFLLPGSMLFLPAYAWFLDRRRGRKAARPVGQGGTVA